MSKLYRALQPVDHGGHGRVYQAGETFDLAHLPSDMIQRLVDSGAVAEVEGQAPESDESRTAKAVKAIKGG